MSLKMTYNKNIQSCLMTVERGEYMNLKDMRKQNDLTQEQLAEKCNVQRTTITMIETGENKPSVELAKKLAEVLNVDWTVFFE